MQEVREHLFVKPAECRAISRYVGKLLINTVDDNIIMCIDNVVILLIYYLGVTHYYYIVIGRFFMLRFSIYFCQLYPQFCTLIL